jgi:AAA domain
MKNETPQPNTAPEKRKAPTFGEFRQMKFPASQPLLGNLIHVGEFTLLHGQRGVCKTQVGLKIAVSVAGGLPMPPFGAGAKLKVMLLDGENGEAIVWQRLEAMCNTGLTTQSQNLIDKNLECVIRHGSGGELITADLDTLKGQKLVEELMADSIWLLIIDNLSAWASRTFHGKSTESCIFKWIAKLKAQKIAVLLVHHSNKSGVQFGGSDKENKADNIVRLSIHPRSTPQTQLIQFDIEKVRNRSLPQDMKPVLKLRFIKRGAKEAIAFDVATKEELLDPRTKRILELQAQDLNQKQIAQSMGLSQSMVCRLLKEVAA